MSLFKRAKDHVQDSIASKKAGYSKDRAALENPQGAPMPKALSRKPIEYIDDVTFIRKMVHTVDGCWNQYDVTLASQGYGWGYMIGSADYMATADLKSGFTVSAGSIGQQGQDFTESYRKHNCKCVETPELKIERGMLSVSGRSETLESTMTIVWTNQTRFLRFLTTLDDELTMRGYVETVIRRTFGTEHAMKLGRDLSEGE